MNKQHSYGDAQVDLYILEIFKKKIPKTNEFFVDVGANDGITGSNSLLLEENGWKGLLVEANAEHKEQLNKIRKSPVEWCAVSNLDKVIFNSVEGPGNLHGLSRITSDEKFLNHVKAHGGEVKTTEVKAKTLDKIFAENNVPADLAFLSVDVEGHELTVFKTLDFKKYRPKLIVTEDNSKGRDRTVGNFLKSKGYYLIKRVGVNEFYVPDEYLDKFYLSRIRTSFTYRRWQSKYFLKSLLGIKDHNPLV